MRYSVDFRDGATAEMAADATAQIVQGRVVSTAGIRVTIEFPCANAQELDAILDGDDRVTRYRETLSYAPVKK